MSEPKPLEGELVPKDTPATEVHLVVSTRDMATQAINLRATDEASNTKVVEVLQELKASMKTCDDHRKEATAPLRDKVADINAFYNVAIDKAKSAERHLKGEISAYSHKLEEDQRRAAEEEAKRIQKNAEKRAERAEKKGDDEAAEQIRTEAEMESEHAKAALSSIEPPKAKGVSKSKNWKIEVTDMAAFVKSIEGDARLTFDMVKPNQTALNKLVKALGEGCKDIPGTRVWYEDVVAVRSK
jgi:hypothetical protein